MTWTTRCDGRQCNTLIGQYYVRQREHDWFAEYFDSDQRWEVLLYGTEDECLNRCAEHYYNTISDEYMRLSYEHYYRNKV